MSVLRTEADVLSTLAGATMTLDEIYAVCQDAGIHTRDAGEDVVHGAQDTRWRRRVRGALQTLRRRGQAERVGDRTWVIDGTPAAPERLLLVIAGATSVAELTLSSAELLLAQLEEQVPLVLTDPPWGLGIQASGNSGRDNGERVYARDPGRVIGGYVDVPPALYREFTARWVGAAAEVLPEGGYLAVVTGPGQAASVQVAGEDTGLSFLNQIVVPRPFALPTSRRFSHAHTVVTVLVRGPERSRQRFFHVPDDLPKARSGRDYPLDVWPVGKHERRGQARYPTMLHPLIPRRVISALTPGPDNGGRPWESHVVDPFVGGGETLLAAYALQRRFTGGDINPAALRFTAARAVAELPTA